MGGESSGGNIAAGSLQYLYALPSNYRNSVSYAVPVKTGEQTKRVTHKVFAYKVTDSVKKTVSERVIAMFLVYPPMDNDYASASYIGNHSSSHLFDDSLMTMHYEEGSHLLFLYPMYSILSLPNAHHICTL